MPALPIWLVWVLGLAGASLVAIVTYFLTSSRGKENAAEFKAKVLQMVEILNDRIARLEEVLASAQAAQREAESAASAAEARANAHRADASDAAERAAMERDRADQAERLVEAMEAMMRKLKAQQAAWVGEEAAAEELTRVAGSGLDVASVRLLRAVVASSAVLSSHKLRPGEALVELDEQIVLAESAAAHEASVLLGVSAALREDSNEQKSAALRLLLS